MRLRDGAHRTDAPLESSLGEREEDSKGLLSLPRSPSHVHLAAGRVPGFGLDRNGLAGHVSRAMMERYSHIRMEAKRRPWTTLSGTDFEPGVAQNWAQFFVSEKSDEAKSIENKW